MRRAVAWSGGSSTARYLLETATYWLKLAGFGRCGHSSSSPLEGFGAGSNEFGHENVVKAVAQGFLWLCVGWRGSKQGNDMGREC